EFPWTADTVYLNNASIGPIPERTRRVLDEFTAKRTAPHLLPDRELQAGLQAAREAIARLLNAEPAEIALATNTSHGLNLAARALPLHPGDVVLVSDREFPANVYPWLLLKKQGIEVELAPCAAEGWPDEDYLVERLHDPRVRVLAVSFVQFANGYRADLGRLGAACRANGTTTSVGMLAELGVDDIAQYARTLHEPVLRWADENGIRVVSPSDEAHRSAIVCLAPAHPAEAYHALKRAHVVCSLREGAIRLAPHCYNTVEEMERVLDVLDQLE